MTGHIFSYSMMSGIALACLYICYKLTLSRTTFSKFNRMAILVIYLLAAVAPFITLKSGSSAVILPDGIVSVPVVGEYNYTELVDDPMRYMLIIYLVGVALFVLRFAADTFYMLYLRLTAVRGRVCDVDVRVHGNKKLSPFSWGGKIFIPKFMMGTSETEMQLIVKHEQAHLINRHWLDLIVSNMTTVLQWYNPAAWLLHGELIKVHEYEADRHVLDYIGTPSDYQLLLIKMAAGSRFHSIADSLNHSSLKNRITMMMKNQTKSSARLRALAMLPAMAVALCLTNSSCVKSACNKVEAEDTTDSATPLVVETARQIGEELEATRVVAFCSHGDADAKVDEIVVQAEYPGGFDAMYLFLSENINFAGDEGKVMVGFTIDKDGYLRNPHIIKGISEAANNEAIRVVKALAPQWTPAKDAEGNAVASTFILPIDFVIAKAPVKQ